MITQLMNALGKLNIDTMKINISVQANAFEATVQGSVELGDKLAVLLGTTIPLEATTPHTAVTTTSPSQPQDAAVKNKDALDPASHHFDLPLANPDNAPRSPRPGELP